MRVTTPLKPCTNSRFARSAGSRGARRPIGGRAGLASRLVPALLAAATAVAAAGAHAAPYLPRSNDEVVETLPARASDPRLRKINELRAALRADPQDADTAVELARLYFGMTAAEGDPRYVGYAQAALAPWWTDPDPPTSARVMRAILLQFNHQFEPALADLQVAVEEDEDDGEAWSWRAAIQMVQADYPAARSSCSGLGRAATPLVGAACIAYVDSMTGRAGAAADSIRAALADATNASAEERLWVLTRLAEIEERRGRYDAAEAAYRDALSIGITDGYLLAAWADFLLDRRRAAEVVTLLQDRVRSDVLLLRLAIAAKTLGRPEREAWAADLAARFQAAKLRGDTTHQKEESRFALAIEGRVDDALALARENFAVQREAADARVLLEAALAARRPEAAEPALKWMRDNGVESVALSSLAERLGALR